jgi:hypothetical protein
VAPDAPTGLSVSSATDTSITWNWDAVDDADGYQVQFNSAENFDGVDAMNTAETWHTQTGLSAGMAGYLRVRSTSGSGDAMLASAWTAHLTATTRMRPGIPMNLSAAAGEGSITWTWDAVDNADSYYVQHSADGAFTAEGESMEVMETSYTKSDLGEGATAYLRVRSSGGTGDQERLMSGWSSPIRGMSATPVTPPAPTGLNATSGDGSISWSWNAVDGAMGYQVQVSMSEDFGDAETIDLDADTTSHSVDVDAGSTRYLRVRATGMGDSSDWATHVTGMSNAPVVTVVEPDPVTVTFSLPEDESHYLLADEDNDEATAMAKVNTEIMVESNTTAVITPMWIDDAAGVDVAAVAGNTPFTYVDWNVLQSAVIAGDATFKVQRTTVGANQMMEPTGDVAYVTCGPFNCADGMDAPVPSLADSAVCTAWEPTVEIQVGKIDNDVIGPVTAGDTIADDDEAYKTGVDTNDGVDLGIVYTSSQDMNVKHAFDAVTNGTNTEKTVKAVSGTDKTLAMAAVASITVDADDDVLGAGTAAAPYGVNESAVCEDTSPVVAGEGRYDAGSITDKPDGCFRLRGPGAGRGDNDPSKGADYLSGWTIELSPVDADVTWGEVKWENDPFEELTCEGTEPIIVKDLMADSGQDICEDLFEAEVDLATAKGWKPTVVFGSEVPGFDATADDGSNTNPDSVVMWKATTAKGTGTKMFKTIWFDDNLDTVILEKAPRDDRPMVDATPDVTTDNEGVMGGWFNDLYNHNEAATNITAIWEFLTDTNDDLTEGDLGKVDLVSSTDIRSTVDDERTIEVESCEPLADGTATSWAPRDGYGQDGTGTTKIPGNLDNTGCKTAAQKRDREAGAGRDQSATDTAAHPDGKADNYETDNYPDTFEEFTTGDLNTAANRTVMDNADDFYECSEVDGGDDDPEGENSTCDADWINDVTVTFADGTFGCTTTRDITITCEWNADGGMATGRNALPSEFTAGGDDDNKGFFLKCEAE